MASETKLSTNRYQVDIRSTQSNRMGNNLQGKEEVRQVVAGEDLNRESSQQSTYKLPIGQLSCHVTGQ